MSKTSYAPFIIGSIVAVIALAVVFGFALKAKANPSAFARVQSSAATSTYSRIAPGVGTTTLVYQSSNGNLAADSAVLDLNLTGSTTAPVLGVRIEHSYDCVDYFAETPTVTTASSTAGYSFVEYRAIFSTSTDAQFGSPGSGSIDSTTWSRAMREIPVATPTKCTRAVIYGVTGSGSLYAQIVGRQQINY